MPEEESQGLRWSKLFIYSMMGQSSGHRMALGERETPLSSLFVVVWRRGVWALGPGYNWVCLPRRGGLYGQL
jgi:hypothetical protein